MIFWSHFFEIDTKASGDRYCQVKFNNQILFKTQQKSSISIHKHGQKNRVKESVVGGANSD